MTRYRVLAAIALAFGTLPALAATRTVTLSVPGMTCPACPITVRAALSKVAGVSRIVVRLPQKEAIVTYDDRTTNAAKLIQATTDAGYPSTLERGTP